MRIIIALAVALVVAGEAQAQRSERAPANAPAALRVAPADEPGTPLEIELTLRTGTAAVAGASVYTYQTDARGYYTREDAGDNRNSRLHGYLRSDADGRVRIETIRPASYPNDRVPQHVHFVVTAEGHARRVFEIVFDDDPYLTNDVRQRTRNPQSGFVLCEPESIGGGHRCTVTVSVAAR